jgi:hypothetical protein
MVNYKKHILTAMIISIIGLSSIHFYFIATAKAGERFQPRGCEFSVEFPGKPKVYDVIIPLIGKVQNGEYMGGGNSLSDGYFFVVEGIPLSHKEIFKYHKDIESYLVKSIQAYAEANGIQGHEVRYHKGNIGHEVGLRGYKAVKGTPCIFAVMWVLGERSIISLRTGCAAENFPPPGMTELYKSVRQESTKRY